ncbi:MAG: Gfo/Idh/MocA family oxidoreductase [Steroidobacteraceae bacterium]
MGRVTSDGSRLRMAMIGGGPGSFIGPVHRMAAELDGEFQLVAGAFSRDAAKSAQAGRDYHLDPARVYASFTELIERERVRTDRVDCVSIVTPNHTHFEIASAALRAGFHVICDKPAAASLPEALELQSVVRGAPGIYALTYTYTGYPLVREAREICRSGRLGRVRKAVVEYSQGWLSQPVENGGNSQAAWRADPAKAGIGGCIGDIGVHAFNLLEFISGCEVAELCADLSSIVPGRVLDDDCNVLLRLDNGAPAVLHATQIAAGERNRLEIHVYGELGSLAWNQERPNELQLLWLDGRSEQIHSGAPQLGRDARAASRLPSGHPEGYIEAFANIYRDFARTIREQGRAERDCAAGVLPGIDAGVRGMRFVDQAILSSRNRTGWVKLG